MPLNSPVSAAARPAARSASRSDRPCRPFRCLDAQYRRELVRVYLTNVEALCRRFCEERRQRLAWLRAEAAGFAAWWRSLSSEAQQQLTQRVPGGPILKGLARQFFNEKEVTSSLVMDALFCGCKQLERLGRGQVRRLGSRAWLHALCMSSWDGVV